ncbi:MAG TPA: acyloxyacyl hydrolase [Burkholderiaceae bacterium]|nr:acyloxyacyl hydrolase [Burkholderiaceae bacterium]
MMTRADGMAITLGCVLTAVHATSGAVDSMSAEWAHGNQTQVVRVGAQWNWSSRWWQSNGTHIGGYWDADLAQWRGTRFKNLPDTTQNITEIGFTPVFRFARDNGQGLYGELGIGVHYLSGIYNNNGKQLSTHFQFGDHIGVGYVFSNALDLELRLQHFSNGGYQEPNDGINFLVLRARYQF